MTRCGTTFCPPQTNADTRQLWGTTAGLMFFMLPYTAFGMMKQVNYPLLVRRPSGNCHGGRQASALLAATFLGDNTSLVHPALLPTQGG